MGQHASRLWASMPLPQKLVYQGNYRQMSRDYFDKIDNLLDGGDLPGAAGPNNGNNGNPQPNANNVVNEVRRQ